MDWNNDGALDLICGEYDGRVHLYLNVGTAQSPVLTDSGFVQVGGADLDVGSYSMPFSCDWNDDGLFDILVGDSDGRVSLSLNDGTAGAPHFSASQFVQNGGYDLRVSYNAAPAWTDLDADTLPDLVLGDGVGRLRYFRNQGAPGAPVFSGYEDLTVGGDAIEYESYTRPFPVDWDNDGDVDIVTGHDQSIPVLHCNDPAPVTLPGFILDFKGPYYLPGTGGTISYDVTLTNPGAQSLTFDFYTTCRVSLFSGPIRFVGPIVNVRNITLTPGQTVKRTLYQPVPAAAPAGIYAYTVLVGDSAEWIVMRTGLCDFLKM